MKKLLITFLTAVVFTLLLSASSFAASYYVSTTGSDTGTGSLDNPFRTIQKAADLAKPGDTVFIKGGVYLERLTIKVSGNSTGGYITITSAPGEEVVLDGTNPSTNRHMILIENKSFIRIANLTIRNNFGTNPAGITVRGNSHDIELKNNKIHDISSDDPTTQNAHGIHIVGNDVNAIYNIVVDGNELFNLKTGWSEALTVNGNVDGFKVSNNKVHDIGNIGIDIAGHFGANADPTKDQARNGVVSGNEIYNCESPNGGGAAAGLYVDGAKNIILERNIVHHTQRGISIGCENYGYTADGIILRDNIAYSNLKGGVSIGGYNPTIAGKVINSSIINNVFYKNDTLNTGRGELTVSVSDNLTIKNNIFYANTNVLLNNGGVDTNTYVKNYHSDYNTWYAEGDPNLVKFRYITTNYGFAKYKSVSGQDQNSQFINPSFVDPSKPDFHLVSQSPSINAGDPSFVPGDSEMDMDMNNRVADARVDVGAYEYGNTVPTTVVPAVISNIQVSNVTPTSATITWETDQSTTGSVQYGVSIDYGSGETDLTSSFTHSISLSGLLPGTDYHFKVNAEVNGVKSESEDSTFTTMVQDGIVVDGDNTEWSNLDPLTTATGVYPQELKVTNDDTTLYMMVAGTNLNTTSQFYIDTDNNSSTGFKVSYWQTSGAEYMIQNNTLYKRTTKWVKVGTAKIAKNNNVIEVSVGLNQLGIVANKIIHVGYVRYNSSTHRLPLKGLSIPEYIVN